MSEFDTTIGHMPGKAILIADALSRRADLDPARVATVSVSVESDLLTIIHLAQEQDFSDTFCDLKSRTIAGIRDMCMRDGLVYHTTSRTSGQTIVIPDGKTFK